MIKTKAKKKYYGVRAYVVGGLIGVIKEHQILENENGLQETFKVKCYKSGGYVVNRQDIVWTLEKVKYTQIDNTILCVATANGRSYAGYAIMNKQDENYSVELGRRLALARAMKDTKGEEIILNEVERTCKELAD